MTGKDSKDKKGRKKKVMGFQVLEEECIWMKAGIVNFRTCDNAYDCYNCPFDQAMRKAMTLEHPTGPGKKTEAWVDHLKENYHGASRQCRHALTGRIEAPKSCSLNYECFHCPFDQMLDDIEFGQLTEVPSYKVVSGYRMANGYYYHVGHNWARFEHGGRVRIGIDDFMGKVFGLAQTLELPPLGATLKQDQVAWTLGRNDHKAAVLSPVTGTVLAVNYKAQDHPEITHEDPYQEGWLFVLEPNAPKKNLKGLYFGEESFKWIEQENLTLMNLMGPQYERLAATGGEPIDDVFGHFPEIGWDHLARTFLRTEKI